MNLDPLTLGDVFASLILIIASIINYKIFRMYYRGEVKPTGMPCRPWGRLTQSA